MRFIAPLIIICAANALPAQQPTHVPVDTGLAIVHVHVMAETRPLEAALVRSGSGMDAVAAQTDSAGVAILRLASGSRRIIVSKLGYAPDSLTLILRAGADTTVTFELHEQAAKIHGVVVTATRGQRRVEDEPTRVDVLDHEDVEEQTAMNPGNVARFLSETGGVRVTATSPGLGGANVRIQGMRGRYTQLLSDGLPLYGLGTEGLGLLQVPPIDLQQIELVKGAASALYGPSALGGVVNFVSRRPPVLLAGRPSQTRELYVNQTSLNGTDLAFYDARALSPRWGYTVLGSGNRQSAQDLAHQGFLDVAKYDRAVVRPRVFWTNAEGSDVFFTTGLTAEDRRGGTSDAGRLPTGGSLLVARHTTRADVGSVAHFAFADGRALSIRGSLTGEWRQLTYGNDRERDRRTTAFSEVALTLHPATSQELVLGGAFQRDAYAPGDGRPLGYAFTDPALFAQHTWTPSGWLGMTSSARLDAHSQYGTFISPRISLLVRPPAARSAWTARLSAGSGIYAPTPFVEELEEVGLSRLRPITSLSAERARGISADVGNVLGPAEMNVAVYTSSIDHSVGLRSVGDSVELVNASVATHTSGAEIFARYRAGPYGVTVNYAHQRATEIDPETGERRNVPLTPRHAAGLIGSWAAEDDAGVFLEAFYIGRQSLAENPNRTESPPYVLLGALLRRRVGRAVVFLNGENLGNVRQTHWDPILRRTPGAAGRWTTDAWAPLDGAVVNLGVRLGL